MPTKRRVPEKHVHYHNDGTVWGKGQNIDGVATGYWEWFRKNGSRMRSGWFENGQQVGEWTTYDRAGGIVKVTNMKSKSAAKSKVEPKPKALTNEIDAYLANLPNDQRDALEALRKTIRAAVPQAEECISYQVPAFRLDGKVLVLFGASKNHCTFFPGSGTAVDALKDELAKYPTSKGAIRFQPDKPLPAALVRKIVKYRIKENTRSATRS